MIFLNSKSITLFLFITISVFVIACSNGESTLNDGDNRYEISIMLNLHTLDSPTDRIKELIEDATNTKLSIQFVADDNYNERLNTAFATGTLPMVVPMKFQMFNQFKDAIRADQFWEIGPYLHEFENLSGLKPEIIANTKVDGKIYSLYQGRPLSRQGIIYRKDWADNLGLSVPTTTEQFYEMARAFTEDDPNLSGKKDTIGITDRSDLVYGAFKTIASWFGVPNDFGIKDDEIIPEFMFPQYMETLKFVRELYKNGYMNQDFPVTSKQDQQTLLRNGIAGMYVGSMADVILLYNETIEINPNVVFDVHNYVEGPHGEFGVWAIPGYLNVVLFPKSSVRTEDDLRKILAFYDKLMTPEVSNLLLWGVEGEHYEVVNGMAKVIDTALHDSEVRPYLALEIGEPETSGRFERYFSYDVQVKGLELITDNENYLIHNPAITLDSETFVIDGSNLYQIIEDATIKYILGKIDETGFENAVEQWLENGGRKIIEEFTTSYRGQSY